MASYDREPASVILDIDDTCDVVHGHQQLSLFNAHYDERCFLPIHVYDTERSRPVAVVLRPGKTPSGVEVRAHLRRLVRHIRQRWTGRASRSEAMATTPDPRRWNGARPTELITSSACPVRSRWRRKSTRRRSGPHRARGVEQTESCAAMPKHATRPNPGAASGAPSPASKPPARARHPLRRHQRRIRRGEMGLRHPHCARGQAENLIKLHKTQLASDRTSCRSAVGNQVRLARTQRPIGSCSPFATPSPNRAISPTPSLDLAAAADQDRSPRHRNRKPRPSRFRRRLPRGRSVP